MIYIDKIKNDYHVGEWFTDDHCRFSDSGVVGPSTGTRVIEITDRFGDVVCRLVVSDHCSDNVHKFSGRC